MKSIKMFLALALLSTSLMGCGSVSLDGGEEAVLIKKPMIFGHGGVDPVPVTTGRTFIAWTTDYEIFSNVPATHTEQFSNMMTDDNTPIGFDAYLKLQLITGQSPYLYDEFGKGWYEGSVAPRFRSIIRNKVSSHKMFDLASNREVLIKVENDIYEEIKAYCDSIKLPMTVMEVTIGAVTPPGNVLEETKNTAAQNQNIKTQNARADAETARKQAEINKAAADNAYREKMGMTMDQYLALRNIEIEKEKIELVRDKKDVTLNVVMTSKDVQATMPLKN